MPSGVQRLQDIGIHFNSENSFSFKKIKYIDQNIEIIGDGPLKAGKHSFSNKLVNIILKKNIYIWWLRSSWTSRIQILTFAVQR